MAFTKNPKGTKNPYIISFRVDRELYQYIKERGGGRKVVEPLIMAAKKVEELR